MEEQKSNTGGLRLKGDYSYSDSGYSKETFGSVNTYSEPKTNVYKSESSYNEPRSSFEEPYRAPYVDYAAAEKNTSEGVMTGAFMYMFMALLVTGITALVVASSEALLNVIFMGEFSFFIIVGLEFATVLGANAAMKRNNAVLSGVLFFLYAIINGLTFSAIFLAFEISSIQQAFFSTAVVFGLMALVGKVTNKDLSSFGSIMMVGLIGVIIVSIFNMFIGSSTLDIGISVVTIFIFLGLTAYDTQKIKRMASDNAGYDPVVISLWGAMELYLDFINLFLRILRLMGRRK